MATPTDDDFGTIGLPGKALKNIAKEAASSEDQDAPLEHTSAEPRVPEASPPSPSSSLRRGWFGGGLRGGKAEPRSAPRAEEPRAFDDAEPQDLATVPPPSRRPSPSPSPVSSRRADEERSLPAGRARSDSAPPRGLTGRPVREEPPEGRPLDDCSTGPLPGAYARLKRDAAPEPPVDPDPQGVPFEETSAGLLPSPMPDSREEPMASTDTPSQFTGPGTGRASSPPPAPPVRPSPGRNRRESESGEGHTVAGDLGMVVNKRLTLQFFDNSLKRWKDLGGIRGEGKVLSRGTFQEWDPNPEGLAEEHLRILVEGDELYLEPLDTINGVYRKLPPHRPEELPPFTRFRIGRHVMEFRPADPPAEIVPLRSIDGEVFQSRVLVPQGFLDLIGPNRRPYLSFPLTKAGDLPTSIGRTGARSDIALTDEWVSTEHARLFCKDGKCWLEDMGSTNGTFILIEGRMPIRVSTGRQSASGDEFLVGGYKIRVIEERA